MKSKHHIDNPDVILIGSGIMSSNLGALLKGLDPEISIQLYEGADKVAMEASDGWNNAGTGHAGMCEMSYTPNRDFDGEVDVQKAIEIFAEFEQSLSFWGHAVRQGWIKQPNEFIRKIPHLSFVSGEDNVAFLQSRYNALKQHFFFGPMEMSNSRCDIRHWAPLLTEGRSDEPVLATFMEEGTDINFGKLSQKLVNWLGTHNDCGYATKHKVTEIERVGKKWEVTIHDLDKNQSFKNRADFLFIGAGGGSLPLLQKAGIPEIKGYGAFPIGGQWMVCDDQDIVNKHQAKVYGQNLGSAPTMAIPHLDTRVINGKKSLLFGPFAAFTSKYLHQTGNYYDLLSTIRSHNLTTLIKVGLCNLGLVQYLVSQNFQSMKTRMKLLRMFYPNANPKDWRLIDAGIRVQSIKEVEGHAGIIHFGTEVVTTEDKTLSSLLGASPGASVSVNITLEVIKKCFAKKLSTPEGQKRMREMIPTFDQDLAKTDRKRFMEVRKPATSALELD